LHRKSVQPRVASFSYYDRRNFDDPVNVLAVADAVVARSEFALTALKDCLRVPLGVVKWKIFSISTLYAMAGRKLDDWWFDNSSKVNKTTRQRGTVLVVDIHYNNLKPWTFFTPQNPPEYEISVTSRPVEKYKYMQAIEGAGKSRQLKVAYGTLVIVQSSGTIGVFRMIHMLIVLSTSMGLLAVASVMTDLLAIYVLPLKDEYSKAKYQDTADFHDLYAKREADATAYY